jgi:hypothetical protein
MGEQLLHSLALGRCFPSIDIMVIQSTNGHKFRSDEERARHLLIACRTATQLVAAHRLLHARLLFVPP